MGRLVTLWLLCTATCAPEASACFNLDGQKQLVMGLSAYRGFQYSVLAHVAEFAV